MNLNVCQCVTQKGKGDVKKKGKLDPYAYIPLKKAQLNRRYQQHFQTDQQLDSHKNVSLRPVYFCSSGNEPSCRATSRAW